MISTILIHCLFSLPLVVFYILYQISTIPTSSKCSHKNNKLSKLSKSKRGSKSSKNSKPSSSNRVSVFTRAIKSSDILLFNSLNKNINIEETIIKVRKALAMGANVNAIDIRYLKTPLEIAIKKGDHFLPVIKILVEHGANVNNINKYGRSILDSLINKPVGEYNATIEYLLDNNAKYRSI